MKFAFVDNLSPQGYSLNSQEKGWSDLLKVIYQMRHKLRTGFYALEMSIFLSLLDQRINLWFIYVLLKSSELDILSFLNAIFSKHNWYWSKVFAGLSLKIPQAWRKQVGGEII